MRPVLRAALGLVFLTLPRAGAAEPGPPPVGEAAATPAPAAAVETVAVPAPVSEPGPIQLVRTLQLLQDRIAQGSVAAQASQGPLIARIEAAMLRAEPGTWVDRRHVHAAVTFALGGGGPGILRRLAASDPLPEPEAALVRGALAYIEGREGDAGHALRDVDARALPPGLSGSIALTQAALAAKADAARSIALLDCVRLLAPGTLLEESALRREVFVVGQVGDVRKLEALAILYLRRFPHSIYAGNFRQRLAFLLTKLDLGRDEAHFAILARILDELAPESRRTLYLLVARTAIQEGRTVAGLRAADRARALSAPATADAARADLYRGAAEVVSLPTIDDGLARLRPLNRAILPAADRALLNAALATAAQIRRDPGGERPDVAARPMPGAAREDPARPAGPPDALILQARAAIGRIDAIVQGERP